MAELTIVVHDLRGAAEASSRLAPALKRARECDGRVVAVVGRREATAARVELEDTSVEIVAVDDGATSGARKNAGLERAAGDALLFSSEIKAAETDAVARVQTELDTIPGAVVAGCRVSGASGRIVNAGYHVTKPGCEQFPIGSGMKDINQYYYTREVEGVDSAFMYVKREALLAAGRFDESYSEGYDDIDFCLKVRQKGLKVVCVGSSRVTLFESPTAAGSDAKEAFKERWLQPLLDDYETSVMWHSWINAPTGYAVSSQYLVLALESLNVDVRYGFVYGVEEPPNDDERIMEVRRKPKDLEISQVVYGQGDVFFKNSGKYRVGYSMLEVTGIPADWVEQANALDEIWVPSEFNRETFSNSGVKRPIKIMPLGVDINCFHPFIKARHVDTRFVFLSVFEWGERKAPEILIQAYNQAFGSNDDVLLLLKVINTDPAVNIERQVEAMRLRPDRAPVIVIKNHNIPSYQMGSLYCSSDCFVLSTRGEGWGMPTLEAMACGLPVISTAWSAQTEFFNEDVGYPIEIRRLIPAVAKCPYYEGFEWADPDVDSLASLMRHVYENRDEARAKGLRASISARENWTWLDAASRIKSRLLQIEG